VNGVSTRKVDRLVEQMGLHHLGKDQVSGCAGAWTSRSGSSASGRLGRLPYLWLDAKVERVREPGGGAPQGAGDRLRCARQRPPRGHRLDVGEAETESFWRAFLRSLRERGLGGVRLCISDAHAGLKAAIAQVLGCRWQRCTVHFLRDMLGHVSRAQQPLVSGAIRGIFTATSAAEARIRLGQVVEQLGPHAPKVARLLEDAEAELLAFYGFPAEHWPKLRSTNPLERVNREIGRRSDVVGIFPNDAALLRLAGMLLLEQNDEWLVGRRYLSETSMALVAATHHPAPPTTTGTQEVAQLTTS
jgi:putative transposase